MNTRSQTELTELMNERYGVFASASANIEFDENDVPESLRMLIPYARFWGIADDWEREQLAQRAPRDIKSELRNLIAQYDDALDAWLAGDEASSPNPSNAYIAFSAMRMCADTL